MATKGNSKTSERLDLPEHFLKLVPACQIKVFLADREFIGKSWFTASRRQGVLYAIHIRNNQFVTLFDGGRVRISELAKQLTQRKTQAWPYVEPDGVSCSLFLKKFSESDLLAVAAHGLKRSGDPLEIYRPRWSIELCFACLKSKGFNVEDTHLRHPERPEKIFALAALAAAAALRASTDQPNKPAREASSRKKPWLPRTLRFHACPDIPVALLVHVIEKTNEINSNFCRVV